MDRKFRYEALMHDVCVGRGWCGGVVDGQLSHVDFFIPHTGPVTADQFVDWLFQAENMDPAAEPEKWHKHKDGLRGAFVRHMGSDVVDASLLKWDVRDTSEYSSDELADAIAEVEKDLARNREYAAETTDPKWRATLLEEVEDQEARMQELRKVQESRRG
jgi:hypothetical protein